VPADLVLGADDDGGACRLALKQRLQLRLPEVPTSGYRWHGGALAVGGALRLVSSAYAPPTPGRAGGQGVRSLLFEACAPGQTELQLQNRRAGGAGPPAGTFKLTVTVVD
jgi:inhibitor of cysteine peptidase